MQIDPLLLVTDIKGAATAILGKDVTTITGFSNRQINGLATQASLVATGVANGEIAGDTLTFFLDQLIDLTENFVKTMVGLLIVTIEKIWNAIVKVIWSAIEKVAGVVLPVPNIH